MDVREMARMGRLARAKSMTAEKRREIAHKAAHREKAKKKKSA
jgi:hypothetical protein